MMEVYDLAGKKVKWRIKGKEVVLDNRPRSSLHLSARKLIKEVYPTMQLLEEVAIPVRKRVTLYLDFYIPLYKLAVEVHGQQHYEYNSHFFKNRIQFMQSLKADREKMEWCDLNNINLVILPYNKQDEWEETIRKIS